MSDHPRGYRSPAPHCPRGSTFIRLVDGSDVEVYVAHLPDHLSPMPDLFEWADPKNGPRTFMHRDGDHEVYREVHAYMLPLGELSPEGFATNPGGKPDGG